MTFDIATADGTAQDDNPATEDNDYVAQSLTGQTVSHYRILERIGEVGVAALLDLLDERALADHRPRVQARALIEAADLVTEMKDIKHPFNAGIRAQQGIEF